ncbi:hypothetical protein C1H57_23475 [Clostridium sp. 2-1]|uniref:hypothetical protein n=1 Tax=Clostridium TaxID=1485 RepID=UPI000CDA8DC5|nr:MULTISPECIES: hypothetical protein [Clostridium]MBN7575064.1 hypothetical protein [Clostridium beijerinckii]MBN7577833.1 hypothetical protein [Clostridium beijerinckii]MBN7584827.1 hypothetical protein [Clostridium beijerinckii]MBO0518816.1 hypothetical protein [Clostridium beijerinckii]POO88911.1 hypothetical protein C1H57_23475 [Clostridium sp. 2-1]
MKTKRNYGFNDYFELFLYALAVICSIYFLIRGDMQRTLQPILIILVLTFIKVLINKSRIPISTGLRFSVLAFIFVTMFFANEFKGYSFIPYLDKIEHLSSGVILFYIGSLILELINKNETNKLNIKTIILFSLFFAIAMAGVWEIYEFTTDRLFGLRSQNNSLVDTIGDIICGSIGALFTSIYTYKNFKVNFKVSSEVIGDSDNL